MINDVNLQRVTEVLCKKVLKDIVKVVVDYGSAKKKASVDTGSFDLIHKSNQLIDKPLNTFGLNLAIEGKKYKS